MIRALVLGGNGMLGRYVVKYFADQGHLAIAYTRKDIDAEYDRGMRLYRKINQHNPDVVINCVGLIKQRKVSDLQMERVNTEFPLEVANVCQAMMVPMIHITTDCVFDGNTGCYSEEDSHNAKDIYGISKSRGEPENCTVIRTSIIGEEPLGKKLSLLEWVRSQKGGNCNGYTNHYWNGITCLQAAKIIEEIVVEDWFWLGVRHIHSPDTITKMELIEMINDAYRLNISISPTEADEFCDRSLLTIYDECKRFAIPTLWEQIKEMRDYKLI